LRTSEKLFSADAFWNVNKFLAKKIGIVPTILLSELVWSRKRFKSEEFFITAKELEDIIGIGEEARRTALKKLSDLGLIIITAKGVPKRYFYQINDSRLNEIMADTSDEETTTLETIEASHSEQENLDTIIKKEINKEIHNNKKEDVVIVEDEKADVNFIQSEFLLCYKEHFPKSMPIKTSFHTATQFSMIEGLTKDLFRKKMKLYFSNPWRGENKLPYSMEGLLKTWNFVVEELPPTKSREEVKEIIIETPTEKFERIIKNFSPKTQDIIRRYIYLEGDKWEVAKDPYGYDKHEPLLVSVLSALNKTD
jgi:DNA-binding transcriptional regulator GbsR (MarR family)